MNRKLARTPGEILLEYHGPDNFARLLCEDPRIP